MERRRSPVGRGPEEPAPPQMERLEKVLKGELAAIIRRRQLHQYRSNVTPRHPPGRASIHLPPNPETLRPP
eukprot:CAMPEP_0172049322 /NCGR_PEP_ID=MMETSP1043-20130122/2018_1 /TAXON_ID=464988 /ORGANISM="Hemiselmis andersenii, Strain CCMP441" /LENGTH=70 /DNA_ID=CAMNT_0012708311 /DNA_START=191 /DNA_END=400 /DNA_ORIENTATION=+